MTIRWDAPSRLLSIDDDPHRPTEPLVRIAVEIAAQTPYITHPILDSRQTSLTRWFEFWPGEHYNLLTAAANILRPRIVWEFCTFTGMGTLSFAEGMLPDTDIFTVENSPPPENWFSDSDCESGVRIHRLTDNMLNPGIFLRPELAAADIIFLDGPHDFKTEGLFLDLLSTVKFTSQPIVILDDIREPAQVYLWRNLPRPKMDMTSFGHFTGTGLVDWTG